MGSTDASADYIIVGAGTCGLLVANRLSADPDINVVLIEPGPDDRCNPDVTVPRNRGKSLNTNIDWAYNSVPQTVIGDRVLTFHAGKTVGGTSMFNGMQFVRASAAEINAWETLGADGWNWESLWPYYKRIERFVKPNTEQIKSGAGYDESYHGFDGDLHVGCPHELLQGSFHGAAAASWEKLGVPTSMDLNGGEVKGFTVRPMTLDRDAGVRASAARAFYYPVSARPNLRLLHGTATEIMWEETPPSTGRTGREGRLMATGVRYRLEDGSSASVQLRPRGEVILTAGALASPIILEASGIGARDHLEKLGIDLKVDLPGVGENLQDQPDLTLSYSLNDGGGSHFTPYAAFVTAEHVFGDRLPSVEKSTRENIRGWAERVASASLVGSASAIEKIFRLHHRLIFEDTVAIGEITTVSSDKFSSEYWSLLPYSRGSVHMTSGLQAGTTTPNVDINPRFFQVEHDMETFLAIGRLAQKFWATSPVADLTTGKISPTKEELPMDATDEQWLAFMKKNLIANCHCLGSAAMMSRDLGGVVDPEMRVYGTGNVRVMDASVIPLQLTGHLMATLYAVAEKGSDMVLEQRKNGA